MFVRLVIVGFIQWIYHPFLRLFVGMLIASLFLVVLLLLKPVCAAQTCFHPHAATQDHHI